MLTTSNHPVAARYPPEMQRIVADDLACLALLSPEMRNQLLTDLQALVQLEYQVLAAQQAISHINLSAAAIATHTIQTAELLKLMQGWSPELEEFDRDRRAEYLQTMRELVTIAHQQILDQLKGK